jgi:3-hydroxyacyl-[acyl-carrier-protein] dehydratase
MAALVDLIPHRAPWLLIDRVVARGDDRVEAEKRVAADDPLLAGDELPELLLLEALAQTAACANAGTLGKHQGLLVAASRVEFDGRARAGDVVTLVAMRTATMGALVRFSTEARVGERTIARGEMTFAVTVAP